ncbi:hypothetical protein [Plantactinospora sonchi]|uniref:Uncharacterized protein n=1 Tax=Plantactinospora sonchi TaxID=1544735 RepID=A0ABU7RSA8_9ACTN
MTVVEGPSSWAVERFGPSLAVELWKRVPAALRRAVERAMDARDASEMTTDHPFGSVRWLVQYEELLTHLQDLPETTSIHPPGAQFRITICAGHLLLPWCYASREDARLEQAVPNRRLSQTIRDLLLLFGPKPPYEQEPLPMMPTVPDDDTLAELREAIEGSAAEPRVLLIGYACNSDQGLLRLSWGEAALSRDNLLHWEHVDDLPLSSA